MNCLVWTHVMVRFPWMHTPFMCLLGVFMRENRSLRWLTSGCVRLSCRCAVFMRWDGKEWCGSDDWWLCYDRKLNIERSCERGSTTPMKIGRLSVELCVLAFGGIRRNWCDGDRAYPTSVDESIVDSLFSTLWFSPLAVCISYRYVRHQSSSFVRYRLAADSS